MNPQRARPPAIVWLYTGGALLALSLALLAAPAVPHQPKFDTMNLRRVTALPVGAADIVALGSSKTLYAMSFDSRLAKKIASSRPLTFTRLTWLGPKTADILEPLRALLARPPAILLLEADLLGSDHRPSHGVLAASQRMRFTLRRWVLRQEPEKATDQENGLINRGVESFAPAAECRWAHSVRRQQEYADLNADRQVIGQEELARYVAVLENLKAAGTRIILLDIPRAPWAEARLSADFKQRYQAALAQVAAAEGFERWSPEPGVVSDADFCDAGHLTAEGRERFERWLVPLLSRQIDMTRG